MFGLFDRTRRVTLPDLRRFFPTRVRNGRGERGRRLSP